MSSLVTEIADVILAKEPGAILDLGQGLEPPARLADIDLRQWASVPAEYHR
jgi:hypothetical protein